MVGWLTGAMGTAGMGVIIRMHVDSGKSKSNYQGGNKQVIPKGFHGYLQGWGSRRGCCLSVIFPSILFQLSLAEFPDTFGTNICDSAQVP